MKEVWIEFTFLRKKRRKKKPERVTKYILVGILWQQQIMSSRKCTYRLFYCCFSGQICLFVTGMSKVWSSSLLRTAHFSNAAVIHLWSYGGGKSRFWYNFRQCIFDNGHNQCSVHVHVFIAVFVLVFVLFLCLWYLLTVLIIGTGRFVCLFSRPSVLLTSYCECIMGEFTVLSALIVWKVVLVSANKQNFYLK